MSDSSSCEVRSVSSTGGEKGVKPARFDLLPSRPLTVIAEHYAKGAEKYADHNWRRGYEWSKSFAALMRHLWAWWGGEDIDAETGSSHLAAAGFHVFALIEFMHAFPEFDDRYKPAPPDALDPAGFAFPVIVDSLYDVAQFGVKVEDDNLVGVGFPDFLRHDTTIPSEPHTPMTNIGARLLQPEQARKLGEALIAAADAAA